MTQELDLSQPFVVKTVDGETKVRRPESAPVSTEHELPTPDGPFSFAGQLIGFGSSQRPTHNDHIDDFMPAGAGRCSACRWFEVKILITDEPDEVGGSYVVHTHGRTIVPGEVAKCRVYVTSSPFEVIAFLTVNHNNHRYVPTASRRALAQAAHWNTQLREVYVELDIG